MRKIKIEIHHERDFWVINESMVNICSKNKKLIKILYPYILKSSIISNNGYYININKNIDGHKKSSLLNIVDCKCGFLHMIYEWTKQ